MRKVKYPEMGKRIRQARIEAGLKQKDCLEPLGDITAQMLSDWENGYVCPTLTYLRNISNFYKVSLDYIVLGKISSKKESSITTYKDATEHIVALVESDVFEINRTRLSNGMSKISIVSIDSKIDEFSDEYNRLLIAKNSMKKDLYEQAVKDLIEKYNTPLETKK